MKASRMSYRSVSLALLCALVADPLSRAATPWLGTTFRWVAGLALMAGFSDVVEDVLLRFLVRGYETSATVVPSIRRSPPRG